jgi:hypothetical protein
MTATLVAEAPTFLGSGVFQAAAGTNGAARTGVFDLQQTDAAFLNEVGFFRVDDSSGRIGGLSPSDAGYAAAALAADRRQTLFASGTKAFAEVEQTLPANGLFGLYLIANGTADQFLQGGTQGAFFSTTPANADHLQHLRQQADGAFACEDQFGGGDFDFNDAVIRVGVK